MTNHWFDNGVVQLYQADARSLPIPDSSVDCVVTSPPYWGLRDYGIEEQGIGLEPTPEAYCANMVEVFREVWRVLKPTGTVWMNLGDSYTSNGITGGGGPVDKRTDGRNTTPGDKVRGRKPEVRRASAIGLKPKDLVGIPWRVAFALQADGWYLRSDIIWSKPNPMPESATDRPTKAHEYVFLLTKRPRYYYDADAIREATGSEVSWDTWQKTRNLKIEGDTHGDLQRGVNGGFGAKENSFSHPNGRNKRTVWEIATQPYPEAHFATYPEKLVEPCILAGCPQDGVVLDPFVGSGTTLAVAQRLGRKAIGADLSAEYLDLAAKRIGRVSLPMF